MKTVEFPLHIVEEAWERAQGTCECRHTVHGHHIPCGRKLKIECRGGDHNDCWEAHARDRDLGPTLDNCEILCHRCYKQSRMWTG